MNSIFINNFIDLLNNNIKNKKNQIENLYKLNKLYLNSLIIKNIDIIYNNNYEILNKYLFYLSIYFSDYNKQKIPIVSFEIQNKIIDYLEYNDKLILKLKNEIDENLKILKFYLY
jgi:hypothetical protein